MFKHKRLIILTVIVYLVVSLVVFIWNNYVPAILMYHSVNPHAPKENRLVVPVESFQRQMRFLKEHKYKVLPLEELANFIKEKKRVPHKTVAITFDDGYKDNYIYAFPILKKYNLPATIFIIVREVDRPQNDRLSWNEIKKMRDSGIIAFGSHTLGPEPLINIKSQEQLKKEIFDSKRILEEKLGGKINSFSYPAGMFNDFIKMLVIDAGYKLAVATSCGKNYPNDDIFALKRLRISSSSDNLFVFWFETSGYYNLIRERRHK